eukprot:m.253094 g.253094  ORF g.253094 m.253094 type:complete len:2506 (+) comp40365_c0_seq1:62-7579(+)
MRVFAFVAVAALVASVQSFDNPDPCSGTRCRTLPCKTVKVPGKCCPECEDPCLTTTCPEFTRCETDEYKTKAVCMETCDANGKCRPGEVCQLETTKECLSLVSGRDLCRKRASCVSLRDCPEVPQSLGDFCFSHDGPKRCEDQGKRFCQSVNLGYDDALWGRYVVCTCKDYGWKWSNNGPIDGMRCTAVVEPEKKYWGENHNVCLPRWFPFHLVWSHNGLPNGFDQNDCVEWNVPGDGSWNRNYLCSVQLPSFPVDFEYFNTGPINMDDFHHCVNFGLDSRKESWRDNRLCMKTKCDFIFATEPVTGMNCAMWQRAKNSLTNNYFCTPKWWSYQLEYFPNGAPHEDLDCIDISEPLDKNFTTGSLCKAKVCPLLNCIGSCKSGFIYDREGCKTCKCRPDHCAFANCPDVWCKEYETTEDGCCHKCKETTDGICNTRDEPKDVCPKLTDCSLRCNYGYERDTAGCFICLCQRDPCMHHICGVQECRVNPETMKPFCLTTKHQKNLPCGLTERLLLKTVPCLYDRCNPIVSCESEKCQDFMCNLSCSGGFYHELSGPQIGCPRCQCKPEECSTIKCPELPACDELVYVGNECCPRCKQTCPQVKCTFNCPSGFRLDEFGCQSCECKSEKCTNKQCFPVNCFNPIELPGDCCPSCPPSYQRPPTPLMQCPLMKCKVCNGGYYRDYAGCNTCTCKPDFCETIRCPDLNCESGARPIYRNGECCPVCPSHPICPKRACNTFCVGGYEFDVHGCMTCKCKPMPCSYVHCVKPTLCENPIDVPGKCCPICPNAEPKVMINCGYINKKWDFKLGRWMNDWQGRSIACPKIETNILNYCRQAYPDMMVRGVRMLEEQTTLNSWCLEGQTDCTKTVRTHHYECLSAFYNTMWDVEFVWHRDDEWSTHPCLKITPDGKHFNFLCARKLVPWKFSHTGTIEGMRCTSLNEPNDPTVSWQNAFICLPRSTPLELKFYNNGVPSDFPVGKCINMPFMYKGVVDKSWTNNYLCLDDTSMQGFRCDKMCHGHYKTDGSGKKVCECREDPCLNVVCGKFRVCRYSSYTEKFFCEDTCENNGKCGLLENCELRWDTDGKTKISTCKPRCTSFETCSLHCLSGFMTDFNGCPKCQCRPSNCTNINCPKPICRNPVFVEGECCSVCPTKCRCNKLTKYCPAGYEVDPEFGCFLDECKPERCLEERCPTVTCKKPVLLRGDCCLRCVEDQCPLKKCRSCESGYVVDRLGCRTCQCRPDQCKDVECPRLNCSHKITRTGKCCPECIDLVCPHHKCNLFCKNGFEVDINGCPRCHCKPENCDTIRTRTTTNYYNVITNVNGNCRRDDAVSIWGKCGLWCPMKGFQCPSLPCKDPIYFGSDPCPRCPSRCPWTRCENDCLSGYKYDSNGCMTCECKPRRCENVEKPWLEECKFIFWNDDVCNPKCWEEYCYGVTCPKTCTPGTIFDGKKASCCHECTKRPPPCPAVRNCTKACPGGYKADLYGCPTCDCKPIDCKNTECPAFVGCDKAFNVDNDCCLKCPSTYKKSFECPRLLCKNPVRFDGELCPRCPARCPNIRCEKKCAVGYKYDINGCMTCECRPPSCAGRTCSKLDDCRTLIWTKEDECCPKCKETYCQEVECPAFCPPNTRMVYIEGKCCQQCVATVTTMPYICPAMTQCTMPCIGGYEVDLHGCPTCECKPDACSSAECPTQFKCKFPYNYNSECCLKCPKGKNPETTPLCPELNCNRPVFVEGEVCPVCPMNSYFPDDFKFIMSRWENTDGLCNWHTTKLDWGFGYEPSFIKSRFPVGLKFTENEFLQGMRCTHIGPTVYGVKKYSLCLPLFSDIRLRFIRDGEGNIPTHGRCLRIDNLLSVKQPRFTAGHLCMVDDELVFPNDFVWSNQGAGFYEKKNWSCTAIRPKSTAFGWDNNYLCTRKEAGITWSSSGRVDGLTCTYIDGQGSLFGDNNYLCVPKTFNFELVWMRTKIQTMGCMRWTEPEQNSWGENYLCLRNKICDTRRRPNIMDCPDGFMLKQDQDGCPATGCKHDNHPQWNKCKKPCPFGYKETAYGYKTCDCIPELQPTGLPCTKQCSSGFEYSAQTGLRLCKCKPDKCNVTFLLKWRTAKFNCDFPVTKTGECDYKCPKTIDTWSWCENGKCPSLKCANPVLIKGQCCPLCPNSCHQIKCTEPCPTGFRADRRGCRTCQCRSSIDITELDVPCAVPMCTNKCPGGYQRDARGCDTCTCKPERCARVSCPAVECANPIYRPDWCCPRCSSVSNEHCKETICKNACPSGYEFDENGCMTCQCKPEWCGIRKENCPGRIENNPRQVCWKWVNIVGECNSFCAAEWECPKLNCSRTCTYGGYVKDEMGCDTCVCKEGLKRPVVCKETTCDIDCPNGFETDGLGCRVCKCKTVTIPTKQCPPRCTFNYCQKNRKSVCSVIPEMMDRSSRFERCRGGKSCCVTSCHACHFGGGDDVTSVMPRCGGKCRRGDMKCIFGFGRCAKRVWCESNAKGRKTEFPCHKRGMGKGSFTCAVPFY